MAARLTSRESKLSKTIYIEDNVFDFSTDAGPHAFNFAVNFSSTYVAEAVPAGQVTMRTFKNVQINRNTWINNQPLNQDLIRLQSANFVDFGCKDNKYVGHCGRF